MLSNDICVGGRLFSEVVALADQKSRPADVARLAASGKVIPELEEIWLAASSDTASWRPEGISPLPLVYALRDSIYSQAPLENLLATATRFIARQIAVHVKHRVSPSHPVGELFVMGEGSRHGQIVNRLVDLLPGVSIRQLGELGHDRTILSASIAALTLLHIWQIPMPCTSRAGVPRVLGRITPGSPANWQRVLRTMTSNAPWSLPLREAI
jgi:1,6-anhydro-N-acetylmuramate kinase